jgi:hypothetical protein
MFHDWADTIIEAVEMQHRRLLQPDYPANYAELPESEKLFLAQLSIFRARIDLDFYFIALRRLLRIAEEAGGEGYGSPPLRAAIKQFKQTAPGLVDLRDWGEHPDDWVRSGRGAVTGFGVGPDVLFTYGDRPQLSVLKTTEAARALYDAIKANVHGLAPNEVVEPLKRGEAARAVREGTFLPDSPDPRINQARREQTTKKPAP